MNIDECMNDFSGLIIFLWTFLTSWFGSAALFALPMSFQQYEYRPRNGRKPLPVQTIRTFLQVDFSDTPAPKQVQSLITLDGYITQLRVMAINTTGWTSRLRTNTLISVFDENQAPTYSATLVNGLGTWNWNQDSAPTSSHSRSVYLPKVPNIALVNGGSDGLIYAGVRNCKMPVKRGQILYFMYFWSGYAATAQAAGQTYILIEADHVVTPFGVRRGGSYGATFNASGVSYTDVSNSYMTFNAPCDGYYTNARVTLFSSGIDCLVSFSFGRSQGYSVDWMPDADGEIITGVSDQGSFFQFQYSFTSADQYEITAHSKAKKLYVKRGEVINLRIQKSAALAIYFQLEADFIPAMGSSYKINKIVNLGATDPDFLVESAYGSKHLVMIPWDSFIESIEVSYVQNDSATALVTQLEMMIINPYAVSTPSFTVAKENFAINEGEGIFETGENEQVLDGGYITRFMIGQSAADAYPTGKHFDVINRPVIGGSFITFNVRDIVNADPSISVLDVSVNCRTNKKMYDQNGYFITGDNLVDLDLDLGVTN